MKLKRLAVLTLILLSFLLPGSSGLAFLADTPDPVRSNKYTDWYWSLRQPPFVFSYGYIIPASDLVAWGGENKDILFTETADPTNDAPYPDGLYQSHNLGEQWEFMNFAFNECLLNTLFVHPITPTIMLGGTENIYWPGGMYRSADAGVSWENVLANRIIYDIEVDSQNPRRLLASTCCWGGIYESVDLGLTWTQISEEMLDDLESHPTKPNIWYAARWFSNNPEEGVYRSEDAGVTWTQIPTLRQQNKIIFDPNNPDRMVAFGAYYNGIQRTTDGGVSWVDLSDRLPYIIAEPSVLSAAINPEDSSLWIGLKYGGILVSEDFGDTWLEVNSGILNVGMSNWGPQCYSIAISANGRFALSCSGGVYVNIPMHRLFLPLISQ